MRKIAKGDNRLLRNLNRVLILNLVRQHGPISRVKLAQETGLESSTITSIIKDLLEIGIVQEIGRGESRGGRRPILLDLNPLYGVTLGVKVESCRLLLGLLDLKGRLLVKTEEAFPKGSDPRTVFAALQRGLHRLLPNEENLLGIGIGVSGFVDQATGTLVYSPILGWKRVQISKILEEELKLPVFVDNDVSALTLAELWYGAGRHFRNFLCVTVGEGIGAGIVIEGRLYEGALGGAGEIGHICIDPDGPRCRCGEIGCLEVFASDAFLERRAQEALRAGQGTFQQPTPEALVEAARRGDTVAQRLFVEMGRYLGLGLKNAVNLLNPEAVILGGERAGAYPFFGPALEEEVRKHAFPEEAKELNILLAELGEAGWLIGAATLALSPIFELPIYKGSANTQSVKLLKQLTKRG